MSLPLRLPQPRRAPRHPADRDSIVQSTDHDAATSRLSAVLRGYLTDPFVSLFLPPSTSSNSLPPIKLPIINRGTYIRTTSIDNLVNTFLQSAPNDEWKQIISLGAGTDTRFFRLRSDVALSTDNLIYHELDFPTNTTRKLTAILAHDSTRRCLTGEVSADTNSGALHCDNYHLHPIDLRSLNPSTPLLHGILPNVPTLIISECCLIYLDPPEADAVLKWVTANLTGPVGCVIYEPIGGGDAFGQVMISNLAQRGIVLRTLKRYETIERQRERLRVMGFGDGQRGSDIEWIERCWIGEEEKERIKRCEMLDEVEEWVLLARHYCVVWGWRGGGWKGWEGVEAQEG